MLGLRQALAHPVALRSAFATEFRLRANHTRNNLSFDFVFVSVPSEEIKASRYCWDGDRSRIPHKLEFSLLRNLRIRPSATNETRQRGKRPASRKLVAAEEDSYREVPRDTARSLCRLELLKRYGNFFFQFAGNHGIQAARQGLKNRFFQYALIICRPRLPKFGPVAITRKGGSGLAGGSDEPDVFEVALAAHFSNNLSTQHPYDALGWRRVAHCR